MKIKNLHIDSYKHLSNIEFDFTYPEEHPKAGQPLDKICIIGQSATGKTTVLELIKDSIYQSDKAEIIGGFLHRYSISNFSGQLQFLYDDQLQDNNLLQLTGNTLARNGQLFKNPEGSGGGSVFKAVPIGIKLLYLSAEIISKETINIFSQNPLDILNELATDKYAQVQKQLNTEHYFYEFSKQEGNAEVWFSLLYKILDYRKRFTQMASEWINKGAIADFERMAKHFANWSLKNENPLIPFSKYFNPLLEKFNLEIDLINTEYPISIKSINNDAIIHFGNLSTGTKGLVLSMYPLYELDTDESIILLDEPERSLFPDIQMELMSYYKALAPNAQIIVATHSPFIAAAFEPSERFILHFDEEGKVTLRRGKSPIGDDPNDILTTDFNVDYYNEYGQKAYNEYVNLKGQLFQETEPQKKKDLLMKLTELGDKYDFDEKSF